MRYRFGFNGMENDEEINAIDFGARIYDGRLGRWLSVDPLKEKYPSISPYVYVANNPVLFVDPDGKQITMHMTKNIFGKPVLKIQIDGKIMDKSGQNLNKNDIALKMSFIDEEVKGAFNRNYPGLKVRVDMNFKVATSESDISPSDHVIYLVNSLPDNDLGRADIGGKVLLMNIGGDYFGRKNANYSGRVNNMECIPEYEPTAPHEVSHWFGLLHPEFYGPDYDYLFEDFNLSRSNGGNNVTINQIYNSFKFYKSNMLNKGDNNFRMPNNEHNCKEYIYLPSFNFGEGTGIIQNNTAPDPIIKSPRFL